MLSKRDFVVCIISLALSGSIPYAAQADTTFVTYGSSGWRYQQVAHNALPGFQSGTEPSGFATGTAPFGMACTPPVPTQTPWTGTTDMLLRRVVDVPPATTNLKIGAAIDDDIQVWYNGVDVSSGMSPCGGCATGENKQFTIPDSLVIVGDNLIAIRGRNCLTFSFLDVRIFTGNASSPYPTDQCEGSPCNPPPPPPPPPGTGAMPSLSSYGLIALVLLLAGTGIWMFRKKITV